MKTFSLTLLMVLIGASQSFAGAGLDRGEGQIQVPLESVDPACRGGMIGNRTPVTAQIAYIRMICTDVNAEKIEDCSQYSMAIVQPYPNDEPFAQITFGKKVFSKSDLESIKTFKQALKQAKVNRSFGTFVYDFENPLSVAIGLAKLWSWGNEPALFIGTALVAVPIAVALTPIAGVYGAMDALVVRHKFNRFMKSVVRNDKNAKIWFGLENYTNVEDKIP